MKPTDNLYTVRKSGDNYVVYFRGERSEGPPLATRATASKYAQLMEHEWRQRQQEHRRGQKSIIP